MKQNNSHDLRLGNLLYSKGLDFLLPNKPSRPVVVCSIQETFVEARIVEVGEKLILSYYDLKPIPLTEQILLDSKFKHTKGSAIVIFEKDDFSVEIHLNAEYAESRFYFKGKQIPCKSTIYVHDLQNAYYMATGENLNIVIK